MIIKSPTGHGFGKNPETRAEIVRLLRDVESFLSWRLASGTVRVPAGSTDAASSTAKSAPSGKAPTPIAAPDSRKDEPDLLRPEMEAKPDPVVSSMETVRQELGDCRRCELFEGRKNLVFGVGHPKADLVFVGEGPGAQEDARGEPFVGAAGQLLDRMIAAMGFRREDVYICNVVKCRPPRNRDPEPEEVASCERFLKAQLAVIAPKVIVGLGRFAVQCLLHDPSASISRVRGKWHRYEGIDFMPTFHPAYLLRNPSKKANVWKDLQAVMARLESF